MVCRKRQMVKISDERKFGCFGPLTVADIDCQKLRNDRAGVGVLSWGTE